MTTLYDIDALQKRIAELEAENNRLRRALEEVERVWHDDIQDDLASYLYCPWCFGKQRHAPDCQRQLALGLTEVEK